MADRSSQELERLQKRIIRQQMHRIWQVAQSGAFDDLSEEEKQIAHIMLEHEEYCDYFTNADELADYEYNPETEVNPFLHITIHSIIENQLKEEDPHEVRSFYDTMKGKECTHHQCIHLIGLILMPLMYEVLKYKTPFDAERYERLLKKYRKMEPEILHALLEQEFQ